MASTAGSHLGLHLRDVCLDLVRIPSVTGDEGLIASHMERWARGLRRMPSEEVIRDGNCLIVGQPDGTRPVLALVGHLDTVPPHADDPPPRFDGGRVLGRGASDMKGGLAVMQVLFETLDLASLPYSLVLVFYDREEGAYEENGLQRLLDTYDHLGGIDLAVVLEPTNNTLQLGCLGTLHAELTFQGRSGHSGRPWEADNAIHKAAPLLSALAGSAGWQEARVGGLVYREAMSVTMARGGHARNVIPDKFVLNLNYRFAPKGNPARDAEEARARVARVAKDATVRIVDLAPPGEPPLDNPLVEQLRRVGDLRVEAKQAWTDVARFGLVGIDAVNFGPGDTAQAHQQGESIAVEALIRCYDVLANMLKSPFSGMS